MKLVDRYTRAGINGKAITCPECQKSAVVYHFSWYAIECWHCGVVVDKNRWMVTP